MTAIFISHSSRDASVAEEVAAWLVSEGHRSLFLDFDPEFGIPAGRRWEQELYQRLRACRAVIVLCSRASMDSKWCFSEITQAHSLGKVLLPVRIDDCTVDSVLSSWQVIDLAEGREIAFARLRRGLSAAGVDPSDMFDWDGSRAPYPGLLAFQEQDAAMYFGRGREIAAGLDLLNRVRRLGSPRLVVVVGASGSGKSSLVRAGLIPRLRRDAERWLVVGPLRPRDDPVAELAAAWSEAFHRVGEAMDRHELNGMLLRVIEDPMQVEPLVKLSSDLRRAAGRSEATVLLVVDQFEELLGPASPDSPGVVRWLHSAIEAPRGLIVLATLRSDFLAAFQQHPGLAQLEGELMPVGPMSVEDVSRVIEGPANVAGLELGPGLVQAMLSDSDTDDGLPLLAFTLREMYDQFGGDGRLDAEEYRELGGLDGALVRVAEELVETQRLTPEQEDELRRAFLAMARLTDDDRWIRKVASWDQLPQTIHPVLEQFVAARLLVSSVDSGNRTIEVAHEALFRSWDRLAAWLHRDAEAFQLRRDVENAAEAWAAGGEHPSDLWRGARLDRAAELTRTGEMRLDVAHERFVDAALRARAAELAATERSRRRRMRIAAGITAGALVLAGIATAFFLQARRESNRASRQAERNAALALATRAVEFRLENPALGLVLAAEAIRSTDDPMPQAMASLFEARRFFGSMRGQPIREPLTGHEQAVVGIALSPNGKLIASASLDGTVRLWDNTGEPIGEPLASHTGAVEAVAFNPDGTLLASGGSDGTVRLWDPITGEPVGQPLDVQAAFVYAVAFNPDGTLLASGDSDGTVRLWDPMTGETIGQPHEAHNSSVRGVAFSPDGTMLASASWDGTLRLWDVTNDAPIGQPLSTETGFDGVAFSPDGTMLATAGSDATVRLWDPATGAPIGLPLEGHTGGVADVAFSPDGTMLASVSEDRTLRLWDPATGAPIGLPLEGHTGGVADVMFTPDGTVVVTASWDGTARRWHAAAEEPTARVIGHTHSLYDAAFNPDGTVVATATGDYTVQLFHPARPSVSDTLEGHTNIAISAAFNADGTMLASGSYDTTVRLWDPGNGQQVGQPLEGHTESVRAVTFSPDGTLLASASYDDTVRLWDPASGQQIGQPLEGHRDDVYGVQFSPDGTLLASASWDGTVRLWDPSTGKAVGEPLEGHSGHVYDVSFSPDGELLASAGDDGTVRLWEPVTGESVGEPLEGGVGTVHAVDFSPDGRILASAGDDNTVRLWDPSTGDPIGVPLDGHTGTVWGLDFSPDGTLLASAGDDGNLVLWSEPWDVERACELAEPYVTLEQLRAQLPPGHDPVGCDL